MHIIIIGCGEVGRSIANHLVMEGHNVVVVSIEASELSQLAETLDVQTVHGLGSRPEILKHASAGKADMLIAVTASDEVNMVACQMAYSLFQIPKRIARVRDSSYLELSDSMLYTPDNLPVDVLISPEKEVATSIERTLFVPGAFDVYPFANGKLSLIGCHIGEQSPLLKRKFSEWRSNDMPLKILSLFRKDRLLIPQAEDHLEPHDEVYFLARPEDVKFSMELLGKKEPPVKNAFIIGGGNVGYNLAQCLEARGVNYKILEADTAKAEALSKSLSNGVILQGDAMDKELLIQENIAKMDAALFVTSDDAANILSSILAKEIGVNNVLTLVNRADFVSLSDSIGLDKIISPQQITVSQILQHVRQGIVEVVHTVRDGVGEVLELVVPATSRAIGYHADDIELPAGTVIGAIVRGSGHVIMPWEKDAVIHPNNKVIVFAKNQAISLVEELFGEEDKT